MESRDDCGKDPAVVLRLLLMKGCPRKGSIGGQKDVAGIFNPRNAPPSPECKNASYGVHIVVGCSSERVAKFFFKFGAQSYLVDLKPKRSLVIRRTHKRRDVQVFEVLLKLAFSQNYIRHATPALAQFLHHRPLCAPL